MRIGLTLFFLIISGFAFSQKKFEWVGNTNFSGPQYPGKKHLFIQFCLPKEDTLVTNGVLIFSGANFKDIGSCSYSQYVKDTIYTKCEIECKTKETTAKLKSYFEKVVGSNYNTQKFGKMKIYSWNVKLEDRELLFVLSIGKKGKKGKLTIAPTVFAKG